MMALDHVCCDTPVLSDMADSDAHPTPLGSLVANSLDVFDSIPGARADPSAALATVDARPSKAEDTDTSVACNALLSMPSLMGLVYAWMLASAVLVIVLILVASAAGRHAAV